MMQVVRLPSFQTLPFYESNTGISSSYVSCVVVFDPAQCSPDAEGRDGRSFASPGQRFSSTASTERATVRLARSTPPP